MQSGDYLLLRITRLSLAAALSGVVAIAALTAFAYYASALGSWSLIEPIGFVVMAGGAFVCVTFLLGLAAHTANVLAFTTRPSGTPAPDLKTRAKGRRPLTET